MKQPLISIIMPTYNNSSDISRSIESVLAQNYENWEFFVINDGSTDCTETIIESYLKKDARIIYLKNEKNLGIQKSLNKGLQRAKGKYIAHIDDDDKWLVNDKLSKQVYFLEVNPEYVLVGTGVVVVDENGKEILRYVLPEIDEKIRKVLLCKNCFTHSSVLFRKDAVDKFGGYDESKDTKHIEDYDLWLRIGSLGKMCNLLEYMTLFTVRKNSISSKNKIEQFKKNIKLTKKYKDQYPHYFRAYVINNMKLFVYNLFTKIPFNKVKNFIFRAYKEF